MTGVQKPELETLELVVLVCDRSRYLNDLWSASDAVQQVPDEENAASL